MLTVKIIPNERGNPPGKLADAELHFGSPESAGPHTRPMLQSLAKHLREAGEPTAAQTLLDLAAFDVLAGLKLIGFGIWERRGGNGRNVTFPARNYTVNGAHRSFALLRPAAGDTTAQDRIRDLILQAYADFEQNGMDDQRRDSLNESADLGF
jgi:hypothetical protein